MSCDESPSPDPLIFTGSSGTECEAWIRGIQKESFEQGKVTDKAWIAGLASTRLSGLALRWYCTQNEDIISDWFRLRAALLDQYPYEAASPERSMPPASMNSSIFPTPAAVSSSPTSPTIPSALHVGLVSTGSSTLAQPTYIDGYIRVKCSSSTTRAQVDEYLCVNAPHGYGILLKSVSRLPGVTGSVFRFERGTSEYTNSVTNTASQPLRLYWNDGDINSTGTDDGDFSYATLCYSKGSDTNQFQVKVTSLTRGPIAAFYGTKPRPLRSLFHMGKLILTETPRLYKGIHKDEYVVDAELIFEPIG